MFKLLEDITVLDLSSVMLGPFASQLLADLGANVIKIESPEGDIFRYAGTARNQGMGSGYLNVNRNKKSLALNLKTKKGRDALNKLIEKADVLMHNMRPSAIDRLGLDYEKVSALNPRIVYCAAVGFGGDGPYANEPAYDDIMQAVSGFASLAQTPSNPPAFAPTLLADKIAGLYATLGILSALVKLERTGAGTAVEAPMFESLVSFLLAEHLSGHTFHPPKGEMGYGRLTTPYRRPYQTLDGYISVMPYSTKHWERFLTLVEREDLAQANWVRDTSLRSESIEDLYQIVAESMPHKTTSQWLNDLKLLDIPCGPVNSLPDLLDDTHLRAVNFFQKINHPTEGLLTSMRHPLRFVGETPESDIPAPTYGSDGVDVLLAAGFDQESIQSLVESGALILPDKL